MDTLNVLIRARDGIKFEGNATAVTSINQRGTFDVLPKHSNFICTIVKKLWVQQSDGKRQEYNIENGVLHVAGNNVIVFLGIK
jgi:F0F1-type ATP synthase epsilon subunit